MTNSYIKVYKPSLIYDRFIALLSCFPVRYWHGIDHVTKTPHRQYVVFTPHSYTQRRMSYPQGLYTAYPLNTKG